MKITVYRPAELPEEAEVDLPLKPGFNALKCILRPHIGDNIERVNVWHEGRYTDMFVDETGALQGLDRNEAATAIYRANWMTHHDPEADPESLPAIYGTAVLFHEKVWN